MLIETAEQIYSRLMSELGPKSRVSLERIRQACDGIEVVRGLMNYSRVAAAATERFGGPKQQTIQNNRLLKAYISRRVLEYGQTSRRSVEKHTAVCSAQSAQYPTTSIDAKTRAYIDLLRADNKRLHDENVHLSRLLEERTESSPVPLADAIRSGPSDEFALQIATVDGQALPGSMRELLELFVNGRDEQMQIQSRDDATRLTILRNGIEHVLLTPAQWNQARVWMMRTLETQR
ncbi:hypothetical protein E2553_40150 [Paraburkholderia dipogonis]|uniref:Uncharacterized protein n=1 Tax=Paraburkholderia dipogonis TaxID=1211383 RepID=A0A4Y8MHR1_9BURK|nr:hypothetical protein [Paraburkholderia dipogonis]TFE36982.1 hypothetical protein E2553_46025 [Paraburkholderia dipogonis]TFE37628.1 hypothetical protein E2553_40150 [Paraburkholderia dipogonis]